MGKHVLISVGDEFTLKQGVKVVVTAYADAKGVEVEDERGNRRVVTAARLHDGDVRWLRLDGSFISSIRKLTDRDKGTPRTQMLRTFAPGTRWKSDRHGFFEIVEIPNSKDVTVRWDSTGLTQSGVITTSIKAGTVTNRTLPPPIGPMIPEDNYTYMVTVQGEVVYIGMGKGPRYLHTISGASCNRELNRLYFQGAELVVEIIEQGLTRQEAQLHEKILIDKYHPKCNTIIYRVPQCA